LLVSIVRYLTSCHDLDMTSCVLHIENLQSRRLENHDFNCFPRNLFFYLVSFVSHSLVLLICCLCENSLVFWVSLDVIRHCEDFGKHLKHALPNGDFPVVKCFGIILLVFYIVSRLSWKVTARNSQH
jgi:hypothetical protein